jgi:hypothetical protein
VCTSLLQVPVWKLHAICTTALGSVHSKRSRPQFKRPVPSAVAQELHLAMHRQAHCEAPLHMHRHARVLSLERPPARWRAATNCRPVLEQHSCIALFHQGHLGRQREHLCCKGTLCMPCNPMHTHPFTAPPPDTTYNPLRLCRSGSSPGGLEGWST